MWSSMGKRRQLRANIPERCPKCDGIAYMVHSFNECRKCGYNWKTYRKVYKD